MSTKTKLIAFICGFVGLVSGILGIIQFLEDRKSDQTEETIQILLKQLQQTQNLNKENENLGKTVKDLLDHQKRLYQLIEKEFYSKVQSPQNAIINQVPNGQDAPASLIQKNKDIGDKINDLDNTRKQVANSVHSLNINPSLKKDPYVRAQIEELQKFDQFLKEDLDKYRKFNENFYRDFSKY